MPLHVELEQRQRELAMLRQLATVMAETRDPRLLLETIVSETTTATGTQVCSVYLWDESEQTLVLRATNGLSTAGIGVAKLGLGEGITGWVAQRQQPLAVRDVSHDPRFKWVPEVDQEQLKSMLSVPIVALGRLIGVINVQTERPWSFTDAEVNFLSVLAAQIAGIVDFSRLADELNRLGSSTSHTPDA